MRIPYGAAAVLGELKQRCHWPLAGKTAEARTLKPEDLPAPLMHSSLHGSLERGWMNLAAGKRTAAADRCGGSPLSFFLRTLKFADSGISILQRMERKTT